MTVHLPDIPALDPAAMAAVRQRRERLTPGALGVWTGVLDLLAGARGSVSPTGPRTSLVVFAADHGVAQLGVSAAMAAETAARVVELRSGTGLVSTLAAAHEVPVRVVDAGLQYPGSEQRSDEPALGPSARIDQQDALGAGDVAEAIARGRRAADRAADEGTDLVIGATCAVGVSTPTSVLTAALTGMEPVDATSRGSGIDDSAWITKVAIVRDALFRLRRAGTDTVTMLRTAGGGDLAALTGFIAQAAIRRTPVIIHDMPSTVCAVLANRLAPGVDQYLIAMSLSPERGHERLLELLGLAPLTRWDLTAGQGAAALLGLSALRTAAAAEGWAAERTGQPLSVRSPHAIDRWDPGLL